jgi:hypothetical protein
VNKTTVTLAGRSDVLVSVWGENFSQETSEGLTYWNAPLAGVIAHIVGVNGRISCARENLLWANTTKRSIDPTLGQ